MIAISSRFEFFCPAGLWASTSHVEPSYLCLSSTSLPKGQLVCTAKNWLAKSIVSLISAVNLLLLLTLTAFRFTMFHPPCMGPYYTSLEFTCVFLTLMLLLLNYLRSDRKCSKLKNTVFLALRT